MGHLKTERSRFEKTDPRWLEAGGQLSDLANRWSGRDDIVTFVGEGAADGSAGAAFVPDIAEMEVDVTAAFGEGCDPQWVGDLTERDVQFDHPVAMGAVLHEGMHAEHSKWDLRDFSERVRDGYERSLVTDFEETRIESRGVAKFPENRSFLRACALRLVVGDIKEDEDFAGRGHQSFGKLMLLTLARVDAGVLDPDDVKVIRDAATKLYGEVLCEKLRSVWLAAQRHGQDDQWEPLHGLALEWIRLLEDAGHEPRKESEIPDWVKELLQAMAGQPGGGGEGPSQPGAESEGESEGEDGGDGGKPGMLEEMADEVETKARSEGADQDGAEQAAAEQAAASAAADERQAHQKTSAKVFGRGTGPGPSSTGSKLTETRPPTGSERAAAVSLAKDLERAQYRDRVVVRRRQAEPQGRLRMRAAMAGAAQQQRGAPNTQEPWATKRRVHAVDPELKAGVMVDISGSMRKAMQPMAGLAWILSEAVRRVQGKAAMVYFGNDVFPTLAPGEHLSEVNVYSAPDMTHKFTKASQALNGSLELVGSSGARLLVVVSDLHHESNEVAYARRWFERCARDGVAVVVVAPDEKTQRAAAKIVGANGTVLELDKDDPVGTARAVGAACVRELERASR